MDELVIGHILFFNVTIQIPLQAIVVLMSKRYAQRLHFKP